MMLTNVIGLLAVVAVVMAHPPPKKNGYSIVTHHVQPKKVHHSEWAKPSIGHAAAEALTSLGSHGKQASSYSSLITGSKHVPTLQAPQHRPLAWNPSASLSHQNQQQQQQQQQQHGNDKHDYPKYKFDYGVTDHHTGDIKKQWESRDGDVVKGGFQVNDSNGSKRVVSYSSDKHSGFNADVTSKLVKPHSKW